ncbi:hypothetical protein [Gluconobacter sp. DsW_058]|uniref:hypothetical protein n=1 Tax=Gluconobacter sp. DsW_058 TaxID=1511210 RepID=UPI000A391072|nr:hypothetical protein [Gluconobacter sp. DsW_058]OUJ09314.1 hypothetical protein HK24_00705 [Gluconobacter sp. DsW_058]
MTDFSCFWVIPNWKSTDVLAFAWDAMKAAVPAAVAWVAYKVSIEAKEATQAQRDIAANQYKISLYEVRSRAVQKIEVWLEKNPSNSNEIVKEYYDIMVLIDGINNLFGNKFHINAIEKTTKELRFLTSRYVSMKNLYYRVFDKEQHRRIKLDEYRLKIIEQFNFLRSLVETFLVEIRTELKVPDVP